MVGVPAHQSSLRTVTGHDQPVGGTVVNVDDPLQIGRIQVCPDTLDPMNTKEEDCPWCNLGMVEAQTYVGSSHHTKSKLRIGHRVDIQRTPDGTHQIVRSHTTTTGGDAPAGAKTAPEGDTTYPGNTE